MEQTELIELKSTPDVLQMLGADALPVVIDRHTLWKAISSYHDVGYEVLKEVPAQLHDPLMVFASTEDASSGKKSLVVVTELQVRGMTVMAAIHLNKIQQQHVVNDIASVYGKDNDTAYTGWMGKGLLRYWDKTKALSWLRSRGLQLPKEASTQDSKGMILQKTDLVKWCEAGKAQTPKDTRFSAGGPADRIYMKAAKAGDLETAQRMVDDAAKRAGYNVGPVWHGGASGFNVFDWQKMGQQGTSEGKGFYFSNDEELARGYAEKHGGRLMRVYLRGGKPIDGGKMTFTRGQIAKILTDIHKESKKKEEGSSLLWNYGDVEYDGLGRVTKETTELLLKSSEDDVSLIAGLINGGADPELLYETIYRITSKTGITENNAWGKEGHIINVATSASHIKLADPITRDDQGNIIPLSKRFNPDTPDIRFATRGPRQSKSDILVQQARKLLSGELTGDEYTDLEGRSITPK